MTEAPGASHTPRWVPVDFDAAAVRPGPNGTGHILEVSGHAPSGGEKSLGARLVSNKEFFVQPDYWEISVEWDEADALFQTMTPYRVSTPLGGMLGAKGVEVVGRSRSETIDVP